MESEKIVISAQIENETREERIKELEREIKKNKKLIEKYCKHKYIVEKTNYTSLQELHDDMRYIILFGDLPSVRRTCKLMNKNIQRVQEWIPIISPQVKKVLEEKDKSKQVCPYGLQKSYGSFIVKFD